jgi:hypothetical protein
MRSVRPLGPARAVLAAAALPLGCCAAPAADAGAAGRKLVHVVVFWLKPGAPADLPARLRDLYLHRVRREVPGVEAVWVGPPHPSPRPVVDDSFHLMSVVRFADAAAEAAWQTHPVHAELRALFEPHLERVTVYDFVE